MSKESFDFDDVLSPSSEFDGSKRRPVRPGRSLVTALVIAGVTIAVSLMISAAVSHSSWRVAGGSVRAGTGSTLFYHATHEQSLAARSDGTIYLDATANEHRVHFRVDEGVSKLLLTPYDARAAGLTQSELNYSGRALTANGEVRIAPVTIRALHFGTLTLFDVQAAVAETSLPESILGMDFLKRFDSFEMQPGKLVLRW